VSSLGVVDGPHPDRAVELRDGPAPAKQAEDRRGPVGTGIPAARGPIARAQVLPASLIAWLIDAGVSYWPSFMALNASTASSSAPWDFAYSTTSSFFAG